MLSTDIEAVQYMVDYQYMILRGRNMSHFKS